MGERMGVDMVICCIRSLCQSLVLNNFYSCPCNRSLVHSVNFVSKAYFQVPLREAVTEELKLQFSVSTKPWIEVLQVMATSSSPCSPY
jgi:hypothetical protein